MPVRIVHTADNHIGIPYRQFREEVRQRLVNERFDALGRLVTTANERRADFFVVAGDLFDSTRVNIADIEKTVELLKGFCGDAVLIVPGNHDHYTGLESELWKRFRRACESAANVEVLTDPCVREFEVDGVSVQFFPCPCPSKTGRESTTGWVSGEDRKSLHEAVDRLREKFLELSVDDVIRDRIDADTIAASYPTGSLAERLLSTLVADSECPDAAMLAYELMQEISER